MVVLIKILKIYCIRSSGASWTGVPFVRNCDDVHILHIRHHDAGWCYLPGSRLDTNVPADFCSVSGVLFLFAGDAGKSSMATGQGKIRGGTQNIGGDGQSER